MGAGGWCRAIVKLTMDLGTVREVTQFSSGESERAMMEQLPPISEQAVGLMINDDCRPLTLVVIEELTMVISVGVAAFALVGVRIHYGTWGCCPCMAVRTAT